MSFLTTLVEVHVLWEWRKRGRGCVEGRGESGCEPAAAASPTPPTLALTLSPGHHRHLPSATRRFLRHWTVDSINHQHPADHVSLSVSAWGRCFVLGRGACDARSAAATHPENPPSFPLPTSSAWAGFLVSAGKPLCGAAKHTAKARERGARAQLATHTHTLPFHPPGVVHALFVTFSSKGI